MPKLHILMLFGGESAEHDVSTRSARNVYEALDKTVYKISLCYIGREGGWWLTDGVEPQKDVGHELSARFGRGEFMTQDGKLVRPDLVLPILHGPNGEDGSVQGVAQLMHLPIVGCGIAGSAVCMDKDISKRLLMQAGLSVAKSVVYRVGEPAPSYEQLAEQLGAILFVKPARLGSSVGISRVTNAAELAQGLETSSRFDTKLIIEQGIVGREIECAVLGNDDPKASILGEIKPGEVFYSYDDKYAADSNAETVTNPDLPQEVARRIQDMAVEAYKLLECRGLARVDFFLAEDNQVYVNEINTLPGFTDVSMYAQLWRVSGIEYSQLLNRLVELAMEEYTKNRHKE